MEDNNTKELNENMKDSFKEIKMFMYKIIIVFVAVYFFMHHSYPKYSVITNNKCINHITGEVKNVY